MIKDSGNPLNTTLDALIDAEKQAIEALQEEASWLNSIQVNERTVAAGYNFELDEALQRQVQELRSALLDLSTFQHALLRKEQVWKSFKKLRQGWQLHRNSEQLRRELEQLVQRHHPSPDILLRIRRLQNELEAPTISPELWEETIRELTSAASLEPKQIKQVLTEVTRVNEEGLRWAFDSIEKRLAELSDEILEMRSGGDEMKGSEYQGEPVPPKRLARIRLWRGRRAISVSTLTNALLLSQLSMAIKTQLQTLDGEKGKTQTTTWGAGNSN
jgi:hypothetical protein